MKTLILFLAMLSPVLARVGETREECLARYGEPVDGTHRKGGMRITIEYQNDRCVQITYMRDDPSMTVAKMQLDQVEIDALLAANSKGEWKVDPESSLANKIWRSNMRDLLAFYFPARPMLIVCTADYAQMKSDAAEKAKKDALDGL